MTLIPTEILAQVNFFLVCATKKVKEKIKTVRSSPEP